MAAIPVTITGVMVYSGLEVGGGPMPGGPPLGIWGGAPPTVGYPLPVPPGTPAHPIVLPPLPPGIWGPTDPRPSHPIAMPKPPEDLPEGGWAWSPVYGWVWVPFGGGGKPKPPSTPEETPA